MNWDFFKMVEIFSDNGKSKLLSEGYFGIERETQRITTLGDLALTPHPIIFGDKAENPRITTDFSESQIEMVTPTFKKVDEAYESLKQIYTEVEKGITDERLWPLSMPPRLPDEEQIPIARFSDCVEGREKEVYRNGLALRYGKKMQMISGIHYNFSFSEQMIDYLYEQFEKGKDKQVFIDNMYFALTRNFLHYRWMLIYLFGASPFCDPTYYPVIYKELEVVQKCCPACCDVIENFSRYATSLRISRFGYSNTSQRKYNVYYNSLNEYVLKIKKMMATPSKKYLKLGLFNKDTQIQLSGNILQKESEFYSSIRVKQNVKKGETQLNALEKHGVKYIEVRILDINPFEKQGISVEQLHFLQVFMLFCLFERSENIDACEFERINANHHLTALFGRKEDLELYSYDNGTISLKDFGEIIFDKLKKIAKLMDKTTGDNKYQQSVEKEYQKLKDVSLLPSARIYKEMKENNKSYIEFGLNRIEKNK